MENTELENKQLNDEQVKEEVLEDVNGGTSGRLYYHRNETFWNPPPKKKDNTPDWHGPASAQPGGVDWNGWHGPADAQSND